MNRIVDDDFLYSHMENAENLMMTAIPDEMELNHQFSKWFLHKMKNLLKYERRTPAMRSFVHYTKTAAVLFLVFISIAFTTTMSVEAYRIRFFEFVTTVWEELTSIVIGSEDNADHDTLIAVDPSYIPIGFELAERQSDQYENTILYLQENGIEIRYTQRLTTQSEFIFDTEGIVPKEIVIGSQKVYSIQNKGTTQIYWNDKVYFYHLISRCNESELLKMGKSIIKK